MSRSLSMQTSMSSRRSERSGGRVYGLRSKYTVSASAISSITSSSSTTLSSMSIMMKNRQNNGSFMSSPPRARFASPKLLRLSLLSSSTVVVAASSSSSSFSTSQQKEAGVDVAAHDYIAVGSEDNPGSAEVRAMINTGGRLPSGEKKTCIITGASSGLGLHTAKALAKSGDWNVLCAVRDKEKMERQATKLGFPKDSFSVMEVDLKSLDSVRNFCSELIQKTRSKEEGGEGIGLDCIVGNAAVYYPMLKDPQKFRIGFHMAGAGALPANRMGSEARVTADGFEESLGVIHLSHFLMFQLLVDEVAKYGLETKTKPRMIIVGSITHNPDELAGKIPPQANLGDCQGLIDGLQVKDGNVMIDGGRFDGPKAYKDAKASNMLTIFEMHRRYHEKTGIIFNTMYPGCIAETPLFRNHYPAFQKLFPAFQKYITGGYVSVEEAGERLASVCCDPTYSKSGCYWSWVGGVRGANGSTQDYNKDENGMGGKFENKVSKEVANSMLARTLFDASRVVVGLEDSTTSGGKGQKEMEAAGNVRA